MADPHVLTALRSKYAALLGQLQVSRKQSASLERDMRHVAATIRLFNAEEDVGAIRPVRPRVNRRWTTGAVWSRTALDVLRTANAPMEARQIAERVAAICCEGGATPETIRAIQCTLYDTLKRRCAEGLLVQHGGHPKRWSVADAPPLVQLATSQAR